MTPSSVRSVRDDSVDLRVQRTLRDVVDAAATIFATKGWSAVTHAEVAREAGYSKVTVYAHWPTQQDLVSAAVSQICAAAEHTQPVGDLRADLVGELLGFADELTQGNLAAILGGLLERSNSDPSVANLRDQLYGEGTSVLKTILRSHLEPPDVEPTLALLVGGVLVRAGFQERNVSRADVEDLVDRALSSTRLSST